MFVKVVSIGFEPVGNDNVWLSLVGIKSGFNLEHSGWNEQCEHDRKGKRDLVRTFNYNDG